MIPLADMHCHLLAGLDDGPRTDADALEMCRIAYADGTRIIAAGAHQNDHYPTVTPDRIRQATERLSDLLRAESIPLTIFPCAEIMVQPNIEACWRQGYLLSVADRGKYLLVEMPQAVYVDLREIAGNLRQSGVRIILAHPEKCPELLHDDGRIEQLIAAGCLVQVSSQSITDPASRQDESALKDWFKRGIVHVLGSDGHSPRRRLPKIADAYRKLERWGGSEAADRVAGTNGMAISQGLSLRLPRPKPRRVGWLPKLW